MLSDCATETYTIRQPQHPDQQQRGSEGSKRRKKSERSLAERRRQPSKRQPIKLCPGVAIHDLSGDRSHYAESYNFWASRPCLAMQSFVLLAVLFWDARFLFGVLVVFLYQVTIVVGKWVGFIKNHSKVSECVDISKWFFSRILKEAEGVTSVNERARKAAVSAFLQNFGTTKAVVTRYVRARRKVVHQQAMEESQRFSQRTR
jgi:hypothetical protein